MDSLPYALPLLFLVALVYKVMRDRRRGFRDIDDMPDEDEPVAEAELVEDEPELGPRSDVPATVRLPLPDEKMVSLLSTQNAVEADLLRNALLRHDIYAFIVGGHTANVLGPIGLGRLDLRIPEHDLDAAKAVLTEQKAQATERRRQDRILRCPACGYDLRESFESLPRVRPVVRRLTAPLSVILSERSESKDLG